MWYVIQVMTGREDEIAVKLKKQGIRALVPKEDRLIHSGGSWIKKEYILFSSYVFLDMTYNADNYYKVKNLPGVIRFLGDNSELSRLSYLEAEWIRLLTWDDNAPIQPSVVRIDADGNLKVVKGVLESFQNRIIKVDKRNRKAIIEITLCNEKKEVPLSIELEDDPVKLKDADKTDTEKTASEGAAEQTLKEADG